MRTICVCLDTQGEQALQQILDLNSCTISDAVNIALMLFANEKTPLYIKTPSLWSTVKSKIYDTFGYTAAVYCYERGLNYVSMRALCYRLERGASVKGFGSFNKWRDKNDDRLYKTHTAVITEQLRKDAIIDFEEYSAQSD